MSKFTTDQKTPSAPDAEVPDLENEHIEFREADLSSFDDFHQFQADWTRQPESHDDFFAFVRKDKAFLEANADWIWQANAETDAELLNVANHKTGNAYKKYMSSGVIGTKVKPGEILFCTNRNKQLVYGEGMHTFYSSLTRKQGKPVNYYTTAYIKVGIITIVNLQPNQIAVALSNQKPVILLPGRHCYHDPQFQLTRDDVFTVEDTGPTIQHACITLVRIGDWEMGFGFEEGVPILLRPGLHVSRNPSFQCTRIVDTRNFEDRATMGKKGLVEVEQQDSNKQNAWMDSDEDKKKKKKKKKKGFCVHENISVIRVEPKEYGKAFVSGSPCLLNPGFHLNAIASFTFEGVVEKTTPYIKFDNLHVIQVQSDQFGLAWEGSRPILVPPGIWHKTSPLFRFEGFASATDTVIEHGSITRYQVKHGEVGFAWLDGKVEKLTPGIAVVDNANFVFEKTQKLSDEIVQFGNIAYVTTPEAQCRPVYVNGKLQILQAGCVAFDEPNLVIKQSFTTAEIIHPLKQVEVLTRDRTPMLITGQVNYQIVKPMDLMLNLGFEQLAESLEQTVHAILRHAFSITDLSTISPDNKAAKVLEEAVMEDLLEDRPETKKKSKAKKKKPAVDKADGPDVEDSSDEEEEKQPKVVFQVEQKEAEGQGFQGSLCHEVHTELVRLTASWGIDVKELAIADIQFKDQAVADKLADATSNTRTAEAEFDLTLAEARIRLEKAQANAQEQLIVQTNGAKIKKIDAENNSQTKLIQERALAEAEALKRAQEIKTETEATEARAAAKAREMAAIAQAKADEITRLAEAERTADLLRAEGQKALAEAQIKQFSNPQVLQLEMMKHYVEACKALASAPTPAVLLQQSGGGGRSMGGAEGVDFESGNVHHQPGLMGEVSSDMLNVFRTQGKFLLGAAMQGQQFGHGKTAAQLAAANPEFGNGFGSGGQSPGRAASIVIPTTKEDKRRSSASQKKEDKPRRPSLEELVMDDVPQRRKKTQQTPASSLPGQVFSQQQ